MTRCTKCGKDIGLFESYEYNKGNPLCRGCYGKSDKQIEEEKIELKKYGGQFQSDSIKQLTEINSHLKQIRSGIGWILAIIVIGIIISILKGCVSSLP